MYQLRSHSDEIERCQSVSLELLTKDLPVANVGLSFLGLSSSDLTKSTVRVIKIATVRDNILIGIIRIDWTEIMLKGATSRNLNICVFFVIKDIS